MAHNMKPHYKQRSTAISCECERWYMKSLRNWQLVTHRFIRKSCFGSQVQKPVAVENPVKFYFSYNKNDAIM